MFTNTILAMLLKLKLYKPSYQTKTKALSFKICNHKQLITLIK